MGEFRQKQKVFFPGTDEQAVYIRIKHDILVIYLTKVIKCDKLSQVTKG